MLTWTRQARPIMTMCLLHLITGEPITIITDSYGVVVGYRISATFPGPKEE